VKRIVRDRHLTPEEAARDAAVRRSVEQELDFRPRKPLAFRWHFWLPAAVAPAAAFVIVRFFGLSFTTSLISGQILFLLLLGVMVCSGLRHGMTRRF
jgi:hypothetical protein